MKVRNWSTVLLFSMVILLTTGLFAQTPELTVNPTNLSFGEVEIGGSEIQSYTLTGNDILNNVVVRSQSHFFKLALAENGNFTHRIMIPAGEGIIDQTIYVKFMPMHPGQFNANIVHHTMGYNQQLVLPASGTAIGDVTPPVVVLNPESLDFGDVDLGTYVTLSYTISASNVAQRMIVGAPGPFLRISLEPDGVFANRLMLQPDEGEVQQTVYVRFLPLVANDFEGHIFHRMPGMNAPVVLPVSGTGVGELALPEIAVNPDEIIFPTVEPETAAVMEYTVNAENVLTRLMIHVPHPFFKISLEEDSGYVNRLFLIPDEGSVNQTIYVRFLTCEEGEFEGEILHMSRGLNEPVVVALSGIAEEADDRHNPADDESILDTALTILGNHPNPFNPETSLRFTLAEDSFVSLKIYNIKGQAISQLLSENLREGQHSVLWDGTDHQNKPVPSGVYFFSAETEGKRQLHRIMLLK